MSAYRLPIPAMMADSPAIPGTAIRGLKQAAQAGGCWSGDSGAEGTNLAAAGCALALEPFNALGVCEELAQHRAQLHGLNRLVQQV
jgi:hypothetical protein